MTHQSKVKDIISDFYILLQRQFDANINIFRNDNAKDLCNNELSNFFTQEGVIHEISCVDTPLKKGATEMKKGDIMD